MLNESATLESEENYLKMENKEMQQNKKNRRKIMIIIITTTTATIIMTTTATIITAKRQQLQLRELLFIIIPSTLPSIFKNRRFC